MSITENIQKLIDLCQIDKCERYTRQELKKATDFFKSDEVLISIDDLKNKLRYRELLVMTR